MTIQELADRAEVTTRTIRYYVEQGVLPPPERGRPAEYTEEHVARLALIKRLKEQYLPLEEIRDTLQRMSLPEVEALVANYSPEQEQSQKLDSATDYIANVLGRGIVREQMKQASTTDERQRASIDVGRQTPDDKHRRAEAAPKKSVAPGSTVPLEHFETEVPTPNAMPYGEPALAPTQAAGAVPAQAPLPPPAQPPAPAPASGAPTMPMPSAGAVSSLSPSAPGSPTPSLASRLWSSVVGRRSSPEGAATMKEESAYIQPPTSWQRVQLGEGIELHYLATDDAQFNKVVARLIEAAHRILDEGPGNGE